MTTKTSKRKKLSLKTKLAATLLALREWTLSPYDAEPLIPWNDAKLMTADQIISLFQFDHYPIRHEAGGSDHPSNLVPKLIVPHRRKSANDKAEIAKIRRNIKKQQAHELSMLTKALRSQYREDERAGLVVPMAEARKRLKRLWPSRPFQKRKKSRLRSRRRLSRVVGR